MTLQQLNARDRRELWQGLGFIMIINGGLALAAWGCLL